MNKPREGKKINNKEEIKMKKDKVKEVEMREVKYKVELKCRHCHKMINETCEVDKETADKIYEDALINPLVGWCNDCDSKPFPKIVKSPTLAKEEETNE